MKLTILGCYSATPTAFTNPTSQVLDIKNHIFLIDCGEGTQVQLRKQRIKFARIKHIFISHLHGDHFFGLPGLVSTFRLLGRETELHIYGPKGIKEAITLMLKVGKAWTNYPLIFHELDSNKSELIFDDQTCEVYTIPLKHRIYTNGFLFKEKPASRKLNIDEAVRHGIDKCYYQNIKNGRDIQLDSGEIIPNAELTFDPPKPKSYAFCSDTSFNDSIVPIVKDVDVIYHESTFLDQHIRLAETTGHSTAKQAAQIAKQANAKMLLLGHFSTRYDSIDFFREEASRIFENVELAEDGKIFEF